MPDTVSPREYPLVCLADESEDPNEITIFDPHEDADLSASWVTSTVDDAIPEEEWR